MSKLRIARNVFVVSCALAGCSTIEKPALIDEAFLPLPALIQAINCELRDAIHDQFHHDKWLEDWQGQYSITLKANHVAYMKSAASVFPIVLPKASMLNLGVSGGYTSTANRTAIYKFNVEFKDVMKGPICLPHVDAGGHPFLQGKIGFQEWMNRAIASAGDQNAKGHPDQISSIGHTFEFSVDLNGALSPSFVLAPAPVTTLNPTASFDRTEDNIVDVSFGKKAPSAATIADIARILSKTQEKMVTNLKESTANARATLDDNTHILEKSEYKAVLAARAEAKLMSAKLSVKLPQDITEALKEDRAKIKNRLDDSNRFLKNNKVISDNIDQIETENATSMKTIESNEAKIKAIEDDPQRTIVKSKAVLSTNALSADANQNVTGMLLQLQLERFANSRLPIP